MDEDGYQHISLRGLGRTGQKMQDDEIVLGDWQLGEVSGMNVYNSRS